MQAYNKERMYMGLFLSAREQGYFNKFLSFFSSIYRLLPYIPDVKA